MTAQGTRSSLPDRNCAAQFDGLHRIISAANSGRSLSEALQIAAETVAEADFDMLKSHGFDEEDIWDIAGIAAFFALSNRLANVTAMRPNAEFYTMGRS